MRFLGADPGADPGVDPGVGAGSHPAFGEEDPRDCEELFQFFFPLKRGGIQTCHLPGQSHPSHRSKASGLSVPVHRIEHNQTTRSTCTDRHVHGACADFERKITWEVWFSYDTIGFCAAGWGGGISLSFLSHLNLATDNCTPFQIKTPVSQWLRHGWINKLDDLRQVSSVKEHGSKAEGGGGDARANKGPRSSG